MKIKAVANNQYLIYVNGIMYFQSYDSIVMRKSVGLRPVLYKDWDYSRTTMKYLGKVLSELYHEKITKKEITKMAKEGKITVCYRDWETDRKSTRLNSSHSAKSRMPSSA